MKSQRRHELQENILGQELGKFVAFIRAHANALSWGLLALAVVVLVGALWYKHSKSQEAQLRADFDAVVRMQSDLAPTERIARMKDLLARDTDKMRLAIVAYEIGREYATKMLMAPQEEKKALADQAADYYRMVIEKYPAQYVSAAKSHLGLAKVHESTGDFKSAESEYQDVMQMSALSAGYPLVEFANEARAALDELKQPVVFATTAPSTEPTTTSAPAATGSAPAPTTAPVLTSRPATMIESDSPAATGTAPADK